MLDSCTQQIVQLFAIAQLKTLFLLEIAAAAAAMFAHACHKLLPNCLKIGFPLVTFCQATWTVIQPCPLSKHCTQQS